MDGSGLSWSLHFVIDGDDWPDDPPLELVGRRKARLDVGRPFLLSGDGARHEALNAFFAGGRMRNLSEGTNRKYAFALRTWVNFLGLRGKAVRTRLRDLSPAERVRLFRETEAGLEPLSLWLNEGGVPRAKKAWYRTFALANARVAKASIEHLVCHPHTLRHSFAVRWYAVGRLVWERGGRTGGRFEDFRDLCGR